MLAACQSQTKTPPRAQTNWACGNLQILSRSKFAKIVLVGYDIAGLFSFHTPTWVPETVPRLSLLKSDVTGNFIEFLL